MSFGTYLVKNILIFRKYFITSKTHSIIKDNIILIKGAVKWKPEGKRTSEKGKKVHYYINTFIRILNNRFWLTIFLDLDFSQLFLTNPLVLE